ncbi:MULTISPECIES: CocE/NonD family hydrolase [unclassified Sphingomonas]|uniref:CocE/NonD family hydrolase n=1 Tax=unclassified Sphingomonas TaxID=196159 RepID=UPI00226A2A8A|nr:MULTISPECIES: CocE/NonD family hydrolase [unclassified Sphingomonas]
MRARLTIAATALLLAGAAGAQSLPADIPKTFKTADAGFDFDKQSVDIPMRDGVKLHAVILRRKGLTDAPIVLQRTPYGAESELSHNESGHADMLARGFDSTLVDAGYIRVYEDVRGKYGSGGDYVNERPLIGPLNGTKVDHSTDAYDTIDWLVKNVAGNNGRVGIIGTSYDGMMAAMALVNPHPALKVAVPMNPVINTYHNDDDFHGGAFRLIGYDYYFSQDSVKGSGADLWRDAYDDYDTFLRAGSASNFVKSRGLDQLGWVRRMHDHPAYDSFWKAQALDEILPRLPQTVPTLWVAGQWDQEDMFGAVAAYQALAKVAPAGLEHLVIGPWAHGGWNGDGSTLGAIRFDSDTALWFRTNILLPFLDAQLKPGAPVADLPPVLAFQTGANRWQRLAAWPPVCAGTGTGTCAAPMQRYWFQPAGGLAPTAPTANGHDDYVSDPAKPIPYRIRPIRPTYATGSTWRQWLVDDQRPFSDRTDVLSYETPVLKEAVAISGAPVVDLIASTTGTDGDFVAKLIDVYPAEYPAKPEMGGYQLAVAMDILRGRYRQSPEHAVPITPNRPLNYAIVLPNVNHVFLPGHRIMVQVQSSWFPLYDRNPQTFVPNIFDAKPGDYRKATIAVYHGPAQASAIELPVVPAAAAMAGGVK